MVSSFQKVIGSISNNPSIRFLKYKSYFLEYDAYRIASMLFNAETAIRLGHNFTEVKIPVSSETFIRTKVVEVETILADLLKYVTYRSVKISLVDAGPKVGARNKRIGFKRCRRICLFSGGVDSSTGLAFTLKKYGNSIAAVLACHGDQGKIRIVCNNVLSELPSKYNPPIHTVHVPRMFSHGYSQLRGFLYVVCGGIFAKLHRADSLLVTECGPTMYQVRFSPFDSITMTTHPYVMSAAKRFLEVFLRRPIEICIPFENLTKAEVARLNPFPAMLPLSHSCIGSRWIVSGTTGHKANCGTCYGCVVRKLGLMTAGVVDAIYERDPISDHRANLDNIQNLLAFSAEVLVDYANIDDYTRENIDTYHKKGLFRRFALDNICALHLALHSSNRVNEDILHHYRDVCEAIGTSQLDARIAEVRSAKLEPNLRKKVS